MLMAPVEVNKLNGIQNYGVTGGNLKCPRK